MCTKRHAPTPSKVDALQLLHLQHNLQLQMNGAAGSDADATTAGVAEAAAEAALPSAESLQCEAEQLRAQMVGERRALARCARLELDEAVAATQRAELRLHH